MTEIHYHEADPGTACTCPASRPASNLNGLGAEETSTLPGAPVLGQGVLAAVAVPPAAAASRDKAGIATG